MYIYLYIQRSYSSHVQLLRFQFTLLYVLQLASKQESKNEETINLFADKIIRLFRPRVWRLAGCLYKYTETFSCKKS